MPLKSTLARYSVAAASILTMLLIRLLLHPFLQDRSQYTALLVAVLITSWYSGSLLGLISVGLGAFLAHIFFIEPYFVVSLVKIGDFIATVLYFVVGICIVYIVHVLKRHQAQLADQIQRQAETEKALRKSEERFRLATEALQGTIYDWDAATNYAYRSSGIYDLVGYKPEEVEYTRQWWQNLMHPDDREWVGKSLQMHVAQGALTHSVEYRVRHKDGSYMWVWDKSRIIYNEAGEITRLIGCTLSIDERKIAEEALFSLYTLTADLAQAGSTEEVAQVTVDYIVKQINAKAGTVYMYDEASSSFDLLYANLTWTASGKLADWYQFPADPDYPMTDVVKNNKTVWFSTITDYENAYPAVKQFKHLNQGATVMLPLVVASGVVGGLSLLFGEPRQFTDDEKAALVSVVTLCTQAIERARLAEKTQALAVLEERHRLARDLHDNVNQLLFSSSVISEILPRMIPTKPEKAVQQANDLHTMVRGAMAEMRTLLWELRPENIIQTKLSNLLTQLVYAAESRREAGVSLHLHATDETLLPPDVQVAFYRIAQECLHNALKHSKASRIAVRFRQTSGCTAITITDDGRGFDTLLTNAGFGLNTMQERAASIGAVFSVRSQPERGTRMRLMWVKPS